jgi:disulfide bond formation protein DsbB
MAPPVPLGLLALAAVGVAGSLALSLAMGLRACPLCFYQRAFALATLAALVLARASSATEGRSVGMRIAFASALGGLGVAAWHVGLELRGSLECPAGLLGLGTAPQQSLGYFVALCGLLTIAVRRTGPRAVALPAVLGIVLAGASLVANPPPPPAPTQAYSEPPLVCRPPYRAP